MKDYIEHIIVPFRAKMIEKHRLDGQQDVVLVLDVWAVHISSEFRQFIAEQHPYIHLLYIPPNCTSKLQVADYALNYPFKHGVKRRFDAWAAEKVAAQINSAAAGGEDAAMVGLKESLKMSNIKPKIVDWVCESWKSLAEEKLLIMKGWHSCVVSLFDVHNEQQRKKAVQDALKATKPVDAVPELREDDLAEEELEVKLNSEGYIEEESEDEEKTEKQIMKERVYGERRSTRDRQQAKQFGFQLNSSQLKFS
jgi:hypothetical protein